MTSEFWRRLAVTVAALLVYRSATHIPLYGVDMGVLLNTYAASQSGLVERVSIGALGVIPIFTAVAVAELLWLFGFRLRTVPPKRAAASGVLWLALAFAALRGGGIATALEQVGQSGMSIVIEPGSTFRAITVVSFIAATALLWWLVDVLTRHGLGSGLWWLLLAPVFTDLPRAVFDVVEIARRGGVQAEAIAVPLGFALLVVATTVFLYRLVVERHGEALLWPSLLAPVALNLLLVPITVLSIGWSFDFLDAASNWLTPGSAAWQVVIAVLIVMTVVARSWRDEVPPARWQSGTLALVLVSLMALGRLLEGSSQYLLFVNTTYLIAASVVMLRLLDDVSGRVPR